MQQRWPTVAALIFGLFMTFGLCVWIFLRGRSTADELATSAEIRPVARFNSGEPEHEAAATPADAGDLPAALAWLRGRLDRGDARPGEALLSFASEKAYRDFLARATAAGWRILGLIDALHTVRVASGSLADLARDYAAHAGDYAMVDANFLVRVPATPVAADRATVSQVPLGNRTMAFLGVGGDRSQWGYGVTVAVLDTGVGASATLDGGRVRALDLGFGIAPGSAEADGHGTAVAGLVAGTAGDAIGVAPAAGILSIRITGADGFSDSFTLAQAILAATDAGAQIINISMGSYSPTSVLTEAIQYATAQGVVLVAAAGNDGAAQLTWPAADSRVISVGAVDALEQQVYFSNAGAGLKITAPGYGVDALWLGNQLVSFDGTSASAPLVAGAIAAVMSATPGLTAAQAWAVLQTYTSDGGVPGNDPDYGAGILNLGWAMDRNNASRVDSAVAGEYYDASTGTMNVVVQNRGAQTVAGLQLNVTVSGAAQTALIPPLESAATYLVKVPVTSEQIAAAGGLVFRSQLINPVGVTDQVPANNQKSGLIVPPAK